jgi:hypothetical protein
MSGKANREDRYVRELMAGKVLSDLSADESQEFGEQFSASLSEELLELEYAAAAIQLALADVASTALPESLRQRISSASVDLIGPGPSLGVAHRFDSPQRSDGLKGEEVVRHQKTSTLKLREVLAWLACAAALLMAVQLWRGNSSGLRELRPAEARSALLSNAQDYVRVAWSSGKTPFAEPVAGDVVWSNAQQEGYMRFVGMPPNNPSQQQYQLWIIDPARDAEPIDGGVFDVSGEGEVVVPIRAKLKVLEPAAFAITIEQPGGVVVSTQERLPLLAQLAKR